MKGVNDIEIAIFFFVRSTKHRVNKQLVSWQSSVMEHEVLSSVLQIEFSQLVCLNKNSSSRELKIALFLESAH
jgi:hypothetical protein